MNQEDKLSNLKQLFTISSFLIIISTISIFVILFLSGKNAWENATNIKCIQSYEKQMTTYPKSRVIDNAIDDNQIVLNEE